MSSGRQMTDRDEQRRRRRRRRFKRKAIKYGPWVAVGLVAVVAVCYFMVIRFESREAVDPYTAPAVAPSPSPSETVPDYTSVAIVGDSYSLEWPKLDIGGDRYEFTNYSLGGTGYLAGDSRPTFGARLDEALGAGPAVLLLAGSRNDVAFPASAVAHELARVITRATRLSRETRVVVVGPMWDAEQPTPQVILDLNDALRATAREAGVPFVDGTDWLSGRPDLISEDHVHPNPAGVKLLARRIVSSLDRALAD